MGLLQIKRCVNFLTDTVRRLRDKRLVCIPKIIVDELGWPVYTLLRWEFNKSKDEFLNRIKELMDNNVEFAIVAQEVDLYMKRLD